MRESDAAAVWSSRANHALLALTGGLVLIAVLIPFWYWDRGLIEIEALEFIQQYLDDRNVVRKVFDPYANDLDTYQARELSYFLDYLDARFFQLLIERGQVLFVPASSIAAMVLTIVIFLRGVRRYDGLPLLARLLLLLVFFSNYIHLVTMGMFYRSSKPMLAPLLMAATFYVMWVMTDEGRDKVRPWRAPIIVFTLFCVMSLLDRQGFFYSLLGFMVLVSHALLARGRRDVVVGAGAAVAAMTAYNVAIAPAIVQLVNGYRPSLEFQRLPLADLTTTSSYYTRAGVLLAETSARLEHYDHRLWYYPVPFQAFLIATLVVALSFVARGWKAPQLIALNVVLAAIVIANLVRWDDNLRLQRQSEWFTTVHTESYILKRSLADGRAYSTHAGYLPFYYYCLKLSPPLRARAEE